MSYNALNQLTQSIAKDGGVSKYAYDEGGRVKSIIDARNLKTEYHYDGFGDLIELISPDTGTTIFNYNKSSQVTSKTLADGTHSSYIYDVAGRITSETNGDMTRSYVYDTGSYRKGRLYYVNDNSGQTLYYYDKLGSVIQKRSKIDAKYYNIYYQYNTMNQLTKVTYPSGHIVNMTYDDKSQTNKITYQSNSAASEQNIVSGIAYNPFGPMIRMSHGNGAVRRIQYDSDYRPFSIYTWGILDLDYLFDTNNNITKITNNKESANTQTYAYDVENRLNDVTSNSGNHTYSFDKVGNRKTHNSDNLVYANNSNRLTSFNSSSIGLNANGQTTNKDGANFTYNGENRLSKTVKSGQTTNYTYNALGQRVKKSGQYGTMHYLYNEAGQLIAEHNSAGTVQKEYIYLNGQVVGLIKNNTRYYVHNDHLGRAERITNQSKATVWRASNYAFDRTVNTNSIGDYNLGFPGQYYDKETGTYYNYFRDYDPSTGRYLQSDPIGLAGGINTYGYVGGNPLTNKDFYGLFAVGDLAKCIARFAVGYLAGDGLKAGYDKFNGLQTDRSSSDCDKKGEAKPDKKRSDAVAKAADFASAAAPQLARGMATLALMNAVKVTPCMFAGGFAGWFHGQGRLSNYIDDQFRSFYSWTREL